MGNDKLIEKSIPSTASTPPPPRREEREIPSTPKTPPPIKSNNNKKQVLFFSIKWRGHRNAFGWNAFIR